MIDPCLLRQLRFNSNVSWLFPWRLKNNPRPVLHLASWSYFSFGATRRVRIVDATYLAAR